MRDSIPEGHKWGKVEFYIEETEICRCKRCGIVITRSSVSMEHIWKLSYRDRYTDSLNYPKPIPDSCEAALMDKALK